MNSLKVFSSICLLVLFSLISRGVCGQVVISQVYEGASNNKWIEITNIGNSNFDLTASGLKIGQWNISGTTGNGIISGSPTTFITLNGVLSPGGIYLLRNSSASTSIPHSTMPTAQNSNTTVCGFNGNDALALFTGTSTLVDVFGVGINNVDVTYHRKSNVSNPTPTFDANEWTLISLSDCALSSVQHSCYIGTHVSNNNCTWLGATNSDPTNPINWNTFSIPLSTNNVVFSGALNSVSYPVNSVIAYSTLTLNSGSTFFLQSGSELTLTGNLTNNGTLTLENGATLVQGASSVYSGTGTVQVKQNITGGNNGNSPNGRFWYLGSPVSGGLSSILDAAGANVVKYWDEQGAAWVEITDNTSALAVGRGHYLRSYTPGNQTLTFTGGALNNGTYNIPLTANGASFNGFNLVSNPYSSYLKWDDVAKTNVGTTIWYRTSNGANNMVFDTYNSNGNVGTSNNGAGTVSQFIPPMQAFWVKVEGNTSGSIVLENIDRSHHVSGMQGMHSLLDKQMFANINLIKDTLRDQAIVYSSYTTADIFDAYDSEKMFQANTPQLYSKINDKKVVINAKNFMQRNEKTPLFMNIPSAGTYTMQLGEFNSSFGSIWLEDLATAQLQNLLINDTYTFETEAGQDLARFVLHFGYPEQIFGTEEFESVEENIDLPVNWNDVSVVATDDKIIDLTASLNELDAQQTKTVSVFDMTGRQIMTGTFENGINQIQVPAANAVYMVHVSVGSAHKVFKVLIQE